MPPATRARRATSSKQCQNDHDLVNEVGEKSKKLCNVDLKIPMKNLFHLYPPINFLPHDPKILKAFPKTSPTEMNPSIFNALPKKQSKINKGKEEEGERRKSKSRLQSLNF